MIWEGLLKDSLRRDRPVPRHVLIVGEGSSGKKALWSRMHGKRCTESACAPIHYSFVDVQLDELDLEDFVRVNLYAFKEGNAGESLISMALNAQTIENSCVVLVVDLSNPRAILNTLKHWSKLLQDHVNSVYQGAGGDLSKRLTEKLKRRFVAYKDPKLTTENANVDDEEVESVALSEGVLTSNLGIPLILVANKADLIESQERAHNIQDEQWDALQQHLRRFCLQHGASLVYTSAVTATNYQQLWDSILHVLDIKKSAFTASVLQKDTVFVPAGWDSTDKINVLLDTSIGERASKQLFDHVTTKTTKDPKTDVALPEEQDFLRKLKEELERVVSASSVPRERRVVPSAAVSTASVVANSTSTGGNTDKREDGSAISPPSTEAQPNETGEKKPPSEEALVNFFQSLLHRPTNAPLKKDKAADVKAAQVRKDAEQSLARLKTPK